MNFEGISIGIIENWYSRIKWKLLQNIFPFYSILFLVRIQPVLKKPIIFTGRHQDAVSYGKHFVLFCKNKHAQE